MSKLFVGGIALLALALTAPGATPAPALEAQAGSSLLTASRFAAVRPAKIVVARADGSVSSRCSKATAVQVATRLHVGVDAFVGRTPIFQVLCGPFLGPGSQAMVASVAVPTGCGGSVEWAVFRLAAGTWRLVMRRRNGAFLSAAGSDIRERVGAPRPADPRCSPSAWKTRIWRWNGTRFVASPWKTTPGAAPTRARAAKSGYFKTPSGNIVCGYGYGGKDPAYVGCRIKSRLKSPPTRRGARCSDSAGVFLRATGRTTTERSICPGEPEGDAGVFAYESQARVLGYGKTWNGGGIRCTSAVNGLTCRNKEGHGFFLSRERWRKF